MLRELAEKGAVCMEVEQLRCKIKGFQNMRR